MQIFEAIPTSLYLFSQVVAGIGAFAIFLYAIISGFKSKPDPGSNPYAHTGAVIFGSILAAYLAVGPILTYDQIYPEATFPRPGFALAWWIAFAILIILGITLNFKDFRKHPAYAWLLAPATLFLAVMSAAWVAKTVNVIGHAFTISTLAGLGYGLLGVIYIGLYAFVPVMGVSFVTGKLDDAKKKTNQ